MKDTVKFGKYRLKKCSTSHDIQHNNNPNQTDNNLGLYIGCKSLSLDVMKDMASQCQPYLKTAIRAYVAQNIEH